MLVVMLVGLREGDAADVCSWGGGGRDARVGRDVRWVGRLGDTPFDVLLVCGDWEILRESVRLGDTSFVNDPYSSRG